MNTNEDLQVAPHSAPSKSWVDRIQALFEVLLLAGLVSGLLAELPFAVSALGLERLLGNIRLMSAYLLLEAAISFLFLFLVMRAHGETLQGFGLSWVRWRSNVLIGLAIVPVLFVLNIVVSTIFQAFFPQYFQERNPLMELIRSPQDLIILIGTALIAGGVKEELQRAFILRRFQVYLGGANLGLILWSVAFGLGHSLQGTQGMFVAGLFGMIFGIVYLARNSLVAPIVAHGAYDTIALLGYWMFTAHK
ncbi:MAG: CPBP family intramembrane metalloprotease [Acidobacteriia bacterium]|nr:CPBP family intramembrane metalloprotease [Terriglobia bacterium]